jgi:hypothetical protein
MTFRSPVVLCAVLLGLLVLAVVPPCSAQAPGGLKPLGVPLDSKPYDQRTDAFRRLLFELRFQPLTRFPDLQADPSKSLFILLGEPGCLSFFLKGLRSFVEQGGAVLIATDMKTQGLAGENLSRLAGVIVTGETLVVRQNNIKDLSRPDLYKDSEYCPFVEPLADSKVLGAVAALVGADAKPDLFHRNPYPDQPPLQVASNAPSYLKLSGWLLPRGIHRLARLPHICQYEKFDPDLPLFVDEDGPLFAVGGTVGNGRVLVLADHSIFINRMILPDDNGNMEFAANCLHWLRGGATPMQGLRALNASTHAERGNEINALQQLAGQRNNVLLWDDGVIRTNFEVPLKKMPAPPMPASEPAIVAAIDKTIARLEENDSFNRALLDWIDDLPGGRERVVRTAVYLLTLAARLFMSYRFLWRTRHRPELAVPLLSKTLRQHEPKAPLLDQRRRELLRSGNVWEMGHRLAREYFESAGVTLRDAAPPRVVLARGSRWQHWRVNRRVARLWRLARGNAPKPLSPAALQHRLREIEELKTALANGTIVLMGERPA